MTAGSPAKIGDMPRTWQQDTQDTWTLRGDEGEVLLAVTEHGSSAEPAFRISGDPTREVQEFPTFEEAQAAADRLADELDGY